MARSDTRYSVYPAPKAIEILGSTSPALNQAVECWAAQLARATARNSDEFSQNDSHWNDAMGTVPWGLDEWSMLANALKGLRVDPDFGNPGTLLAAAVEDAHVLEKAGWKAFDTASGDATVIKPESVEGAVSRLIEKLRNLSYDRAWAIIIAVQWFWDRQNEGIDIKKDNWWTLAFRREWSRKRSAKAAAQPREKGKSKRQPQSKQ